MIGAARVITPTKRVAMAHVQEKPEWWPPVDAGLMSVATLTRTARAEYDQGGTYNPETETVSANGIVPRHWWDALVHSANANEARINGIQQGGGGAGFLSEPARTNLCLQTEDLSTTWGTTVCAVGAATGVTAPDGSTAGQWKVTDSNTNKFSRVHQTLAGGVLTDNLQYVLSVWVKYGSSADFSLYFYDVDGTANRLLVDFAFTAGVPSVASEDIGTGGVEPEPIGGWYRCYAVVPVNTIVGANGHSIRLCPTNFGGRQAAEYTYFWGANFEQGTTPTSYVPVTTAAVTRAADVLEYATFGDISSGLVAHWKLDETTGASAADATGNGHTGTLENMENGDWGAAVHDNGLAFEGTNEIVSIPHHANLTFGANDFSVAISVKKLQSSTGYDDIFAFTKWTNAGVDIANCEWALMMCNGDGELDYPNISIGDGSTWYKAEWATEMTIGIWYRLLGVRDGNTLRLYVNGVERATRDVTGVTMASPGTEVEIAGSAADTFYTEMEADDARIWNRALTPEEAAEDALGTGPQPTEGTLVVAVTPQFTGSDHGASAVILDTRTADGDDGIKLDIDASGNPHLLVRSGGADVASLTDSGYTVASGTLFMATIHWAANDFSLKINQRAAQTDTSGAAPNAMGDLYIGCDKDSAAQAMSMISYVLSYNRVIADDEDAKLYNEYIGPKMAIVG